MEIFIGVAKTKKVGATGHGDGVEIMERPSGGITAVVADGHGGSRSVSGISTLTALKTSQLIADGVRDSFIPRSIYDYFCSIQEANFTIALTLISADTETGQLIVCRNTHCPVLIRQEFGVDVYDEPVPSIGGMKNIKPSMVQLALAEGLIAVGFSDGVLQAGRRRGRFFDLKMVNRLLTEAKPQDVQFLADSILEHAMALDSFQAQDHMTVVAVGIGNTETENRMERRTVRFTA